MVFESCDVGLGESVDTIPPTISITYPPTSSVIRDAFVVSGTWVDDKGVSLVKVTLKNEETGETVASRFAGIGIGTWNTSFNVASKDESGKLIYPIPDGKYTISVTAMDLSGRISATSYRSIEIDNTAPVFVITSPGISVYEVLGFSDENQVINQGTATPYGSIFKVNGSIAEAHTVKKITVDVIRKKDNKKITWTESNVNTAGGTSVTLASYGSSNEELNKNYSEVYDDKIAGNQEYYCSITLEDSAVVYQGGAENTGNTTSELWLNDSIYGIDAGDNDLLSKNAAHQYEISDLQKMINGTYSRSADVDAAMAILSKTKVDTTKNNLKFTLNKDANPTYSFLGYSFDSTPGQNKAAQGSKITFKVEAGKNGTQFKPSTFKVYLLGPYSEGSVPADLYGKLKDNFENVIKELEAVDEGQDEDKKLLHKIYDGSDETYGYKGSSLSSWTESIAMPEGVVKADYEYLLFATGMDQDGVFLINDGNKFGFKGTVTGEKPIVYINTEIKDDGYSTLEFLKNFKARIESTETNISDVYLGITVKDLRNNSNVVAELKNIVIEKNVYTKKYYLNSAGDVADADKNIDLVQHIKNIKDTLINDEKTAYETFITKAFEDISGKLYNYTVEIKGESPSGTGKEVFTAKLDTEDPDVNKITITPSIADSKVATKKYLNGVVTVTAKTTKNEIHAVKVTLFTGSEPAEGAPAYEGTSSDISAKFDTTKLTDNQPLKIRFEITDKAGNSQTIDKALFGDGSIKYEINQKTDEPTIKLSGVDANLTDSSAITVGKNLFGMGNNTLYGTISDDDGLESVTIFVDGVQKKKYTSELHGDTVYSLNEDVSGWGAGDHELKIVVEDKSTKLDASGNEIANHQTVTLDGMAFAYDNDLPTINVSTVNSKSYSSGMWLGKNFTVIGKASDSSGVASVEMNLTTAASAPDTVLSDTAEAPALKFSSWKDVVSNHVDGKSVNRVYTVKDKYGRTNEVSIIYNIDTQAPVFNPAYINIQGTRASSTDAISLADAQKEGTWFINGNIKIDGWANASGAALIEANADSISVDVNNSVINPQLVEGSADKNTFSATIPLADGTTTINLSTSDKAGNGPAAQPITLKVDTTAPVVTDSLVLSTSKGSFTSGETLLEDSLTVKVKATDAISGIKSAEIQGADASSTSPDADGYYVLTLNKSDLSDGSNDLTVVITDNAGNKNTDKRFTVVVDKVKPVIASSINVLPTVTENLTAYVNGVITVSGRVTDETKLKNADGLRWWVTGTPVASGNTSSGTLTAIASSSYSNKCSLSDGASSDFSIKIDTATLKDGVYIVHLIATDFAGNDSVESTVNFTAKQSTNIPTVVLSGVTQTFVETESEKVTAGKNLFGMGNNTLYGTVKDDNGLSSIKIYVDGVDEEHLKTTIDSSVLNGTTVYSLNEDVTGWGSGTHKLYIVVEDTSAKLDSDGVTEIPAPVKTGTDNSAANVYGMSFAYDNDLPVINISKVNEKSYTSGMWLPKAFNVVGAASDASGVASVTLKSQTAGTAPATSITGSELAFSSWQDAVSGHIDANNVERIYLVTDKYGRTSEVSIKYSVDTVDPVLNTGFMQIEGQRKIAATADQTISGTAETGNGPFTNAVKTGSDIWFTNGSITIAGFVKTTGSLSEQGAALVEKNPDSITVVLNGDTTNPLSINPEVKDSGKGYEAFSTTLSFPEGISVPVQLSVKDMAGNGPVTKTINLKVDTKAPVVEIENPIAANTYTKDDTLSITPTVTDETSGIANIYVGTSSNVSSTNNIGSGTTSGTAISCDISSLIDGIYTIYVIAVDNAGNVSNPVSAGSITVDRTNPVVTVNAPLSESNIYKTYTLSGTVSESNLDTSKAPVLYIWGKLSAESENSWKKATDLYPSCVGITADDAFVNANGAWSINLDTTKINAASGSTTKVYAAIGLTDKAGNTSVPAAAPVTSGDNESYSLIVNQDYDRPVVSVSSVNSSNSSISTKTIRGTVTDNNGQIQNFWIIESDKYDAVKSFSGGVPETTGDNAWTEVPVQSSGAWSHSFESDGEYKLLFCVKDKSGSIFHTKQTSALSRPRIALGATDASDAVDNDAALVFSIDSTSPEITMLISNEELPADDSKSKSKWGAAGIVYGGTKNSLYIKLEVVEDHPARTGDGTAGSPYVYKLPSVKIAGTSVNDSDIALRDGTSVTGAGTSENPYVFLLKPIELAELAYREKQGSQSVMAFLADSANMEGQGGTSIILDYSLPEVSIITPTPQISDAVSSAISVKGLVTDSYSDIAKLEYVIPEKAHKDDYTVDSTNWAVVNTTSSSWEIEYSSGSTESTQSLCYYGANYDKYEGAAEVSSGLGIYKIPLWFRVTDSVGNKGIVTGKKNDKGVVEPYYVYVDPNGGKPKAWINAPETGSVTSGIVSVYGGASDNVSVSRVCVQIDADDDGDFDEADFEALKTALPYQTPVQANASTFAAGDLVASSAADANDWYIVAEGTNSWKTTYDSSKLAAYSGSTTALRINGKKYLSVRVRAIDNDGETRLSSEPNVITIDNTAPWFTDVKLCQYGSDFDGTVTDGSTTDPIVLGSSKRAPLSEREYVSGMYISDVTRTTSGAWYLIATINSNSGIKSVTAQAEISQTQNVIDIAKDGVTTFLSANITDDVWVEGESKHIERTSTGTTADDFKTFTLKIPLDTTQSGVIYATISAKNGVGTGTQTVKINIDSTAPALYNASGAETYNATTDANLRLKSQQKVIGKNSSSSQSYATIENSDGYFTFGDRVNENGSGLQAVAFYFENDIQNMVYDPMVNNSGTTIGSKTNGNLYINEDNLAALYIDSATRSAESTFESDVVENNVHIRKGGLVKIGGVYHTILDVTGKVVTFSPSVSKSFTEVEVIYAQVVDHMLAENLDVDEDDNEIIQNDDGDLMCEVINQIGSTYEWNASIDSNHIPDGSTYIRIVAIDNAGNLSHGKVLSMVANNRPRITKVFIGTDLNGNSKYDFDAEEAPVVSTSKNLRTADGTAFGEFNYYTAYNKRSGAGQSTVTLDSKDFKVVDGLCIVPEFVGGNTSLKYILKKGAQTTPQTGTPVDMTARTSLPVQTVAGGINMFGNAEIGDDGNTNPIAYGVSDNTDPRNPVSYGDFGGIIISSDNSVFTGVADGDLTTVSLTFWDNTDNEQENCKSQWALLNIPVTLKTSDSVPPVPLIKPFHWLSATDNSIHIVDDVLQGHIELEDDLTEKIKAAFGDTDSLKKPKVSGKIKLEGIVSDDVRLKAISINLFGSSSNVATYENGEWVSGQWAYTSESNQWTQTSVDLPSGITAFEAEDLGVSQNGHKVKFTAVIDTEIVGVIGKDKVITVNAYDWKGNNVNSPRETQTKRSYALWSAKKSEPDAMKTYFTDPACTVAVTEKTNDSDIVYKNEFTDCYIMDVVPYVTEIVTPLSPFYRQAPSVYARTALGSYPVKEGASVEFRGFNLGTDAAKVTINGMTAKTSLSGGNKITIEETSSGKTGATSGAVSVYVNDIPAINNLNNNDAQGNANKTLTSSNYEDYAYNRQPNGINNNMLTDDLAIDVWQFKDAARPVNGGAELVTMKINPKTGVPGFSYANSVLYFNMPAYNSDGNGEYSWGADNKTVTGSQYSQIPVGMNYGGFSHNSFCFDDYGYSYGAAMCTDTQNTDASAFFQFFSRETPIRYDKYDQNMNYANCANASRIDSSTMNLGTSDETKQTNINRIQSISMDTSYSGGLNAPTTGTPVYVYMAYFDDITKQVRFRWGTVGDASDNIDGKDSRTDSNSFNSRKGYAYGLNDVVNQIYTGFAQGAKTDGACRPSVVSDSYIKYSNTENNGVPIQVIAQGDITVGGTIKGEYKQSTTYKAGKYVAMGIVDKKTTSPKAVVFWSDGLKLYMAYNENPTTTKVWTSKIVDNNGGLNVKCAVDSVGGIHVAYYTTNGGNLKYAYLSSYTATPSICVVDANGAVGTKCTIDVVKNDSGKQVPYISYQLIGGVATYNAKVAYRTDFTQDNFAGADEKDFYTGKWEISVVPTSSLLKDDTINIGLWRDSDGTAKAFTSNKNWKSADILQYGGGAGTSSFASVYNGTMNVGSPSIVYGNNTANPIVGYGVESGAIEIAQKK